MGVPRCWDDDLPLPPASKQDVPHRCSPTGTQLHRGMGWRPPGLMDAVLK